MPLEILQSEGDVRAMSFTLTKNRIKEYGQGPYNTVNIGAVVNSKWGYDIGVLTEENLADLMRGKVLCFDVCGEYELFLVANQKNNS